MDTLRVTGILRAVKMFVGGLKRTSNMIKASCKNRLARMNLSFGVNCWFDDTGWIGIVAFGGLAG